ncbi:P-loop containing nucleoside triphosphate hydrolase protein [Ceratobasidium sp. AG-I]|nr:P-loop containing nucleoside triphosphate hydrolase protein [Ceratobasidium sp. AG-I]
MSGGLGIDLASIEALRTFIPAIFSLTCTGVLLLSYLLNLWKPTRALFDFLGRPFRPFLTLDDVAEYEPSLEKIEVPLVEITFLRTLCFIQTIGWLFWTVFSLANGTQYRSLIGFALISLAWLVQSIRLFPRPTSPPYTLLLFAIINLLSACFDVVYFRASPRDMYNTTALSHAIRALCCVIIMFLAGRYPVTPILPSPDVAKPGDPPTNKLTSPEDAVSLWGWMTFSFMNPLFKLADERSVRSSEDGKYSLNDEDVWALSPTFAHRNVFRRYMREAKSSGYGSSLLWYLLRSNSFDLLIDITIEMYSSVAGFVPPYALQRILRSLEQMEPGGSAPREAYIWALVTFVAHMSFAQFDIVHRWHTRRCYERTRGTLFCALHYKALKRRDLSGAVPSEKEKGGEKNLAGADIGRIVNLMQGDAYAVAQRFWEFSAVFSAPIRLGIALYFLYNVLGWSSFAGVLVVLLAYAINYPLARWNISITRESWKARDKRMSAVSELLTSLRFLKYMGWETRWASEVKQARAVELAWRVQENICSVLIAFIWTWVPSAVVLVAFTSYTLLAKEPLTVSRAFTAIEVFSQLQGPMAQLPQQIFALLHAYVSMQRIQAFLAEPEVEDWACGIKREEDTPDTTTDNDKIGFRNASFRWHWNPTELEDPLERDSSTFMLSDITVDMPLGKLTLVTGVTGSGKSSLLAALLGEMDCVKGQVYLDKRRHAVSYAGQHPWLEHATIRDNILYGLPFNKARYEAVLDACALRPDLKIFEAGDQTEIGEKGVSLSGGQRARCALARAVYSYSKTVLLDDPLAAVDMHTARHLVDRCFSGPLMRGRTIVLVTHHVRMCLDAASYLVEIGNGHVISQGTIGDLRRQGQLSAIISQDDTVDNEPEDTPAPGEAFPDNVNEADMDTPNEGSSDEDGNTSAHNGNIGKLVDEEARAEGRVSLWTYWTYIQAASVWSWFATLLLLLALRAITIGSQLFLSKWSEAYGRKPDTTLFFIHAFRSYDGFWSWLESLPPPSENSVPWLLIYFSISLVGAFTVLTYISIGYWSSLLASRSLFTAMLNRVVRAPSRWLDVTPVGRVLNRFVSDIGAVDSALNPSARAALSGTINFIASFLVIVLFVPSFLPFALVIAWLYIRIAPPFVRASRDLRRLESISLSPAFSGFDELLHGLVHVRAFGAESRYQEGFYKKVDRFQKFDHQYWNCSFWLMWRYDCLGSVVVMLGTLFALLSRVQAGTAAVVIVQAGVFAEASRQLVRVFAQLELDFNSVERIGEYLDLPQEAPAVIANARPPAHWPSRTGGISVEHLVMRYAEGLPDVLRDLSFEVKPREKVGVVGRTGSGKTSLALSLLRAIEPAGGRIIIDGIDICSIGLDDLRSRVTLVSQDVALFSGSVRSNLDPFNEYSDEECWDALERCHLGQRVQTTDPNSSNTVGRILLSSLDTPVSAGGKSFSAGQRQLLALARAMLRRSAVIIMDEATSSIDLETDDQIQHTIREEMSDALVITIAHRLKTVIDYDRVLVLDHGEVAEFDAPSTLMGQAGGVFRSMCQRSSDWDELSRIAGRHQPAK